MMMMKPFGPKRHTLPMLPKRAAISSKKRKKLRELRREAYHPRPTKARIVARFFLTKILCRGALLYMKCPVKVTSLGGVKGATCSLLLTPTRFPQDLLAIFRCEKRWLTLSRWALSVMTTNRQGTIRKGHNSTVMKNRCQRSWAALTRLKPRVGGEKKLVSNPISSPKSSENFQAASTGQNRWSETSSS